MRIESVNPFCKKISEANFSTRTHNALINYSLRNDSFWDYSKSLAENIMSKSPDEILRIRNVGLGAIDELKDYMFRNGYAWGETAGGEKVGSDLASKFQIERLKKRLNKLEMQVLKDMEALKKTKERIELWERTLYGGENDGMDKSNIPKSNE